MQPDGHLYGHHGEKEERAKNRHPETVASTLT